MDSVDSDWLLIGSCLPLRVEPAACQAPRTSLLAPWGALPEAGGHTGPGTYTAVAGSEALAQEG